MNTLNFEETKLLKFNQGYCWCKKCERFKVFDDFYIRDDLKLGYSSECKECIKERSRKSINSRKELIKEYQSQYKKDNTEKNNQYHREYTQNNKDKRSEISKKSYEKNKEKKKEYSRIYLSTEKGRQINCQKEQRRRSRKKGLVADLTINEWNNTLEYFKDNSCNIHCAYCDCILKKPIQEHIIPVIKCGEFTKNNIIPSCKNCNSSKGDKSLDEFFIYSDKFTKLLYEKILAFIEYYSEVA